MPRTSLQSPLQVAGQAWRRDLGRRRRLRDHRPPGRLRVRHPRARDRPADSRRVVPRRLRGRDNVRGAAVSRPSSSRCSRRPGHGMTARRTALPNAGRPGDVQRGGATSWIATSPKDAAIGSRSSAATSASPTRACGSRPPMRHRAAADAACNPGIGSCCCCSTAPSSSTRSSARSNRRRARSAEHGCGRPADYQYVILRLARRES